MDPDCIRLHSAYNPVREAERYAATATGKEIPRFIVVTEPGDSHLAPVLHSRFPDAALLALRYTSEKFLDSDSLWSSVWRPEGSETVSDFLYRCIPEEYIPQTVFIPWKPADSLWPEKAKEIWNSIADFIRLQSGIIRTRTHFGKRWFSNMVHSIIFAQNPVCVSGLESPVLLACSGPSLETILPIKTGSFHVLAVSSALTTLVANGTTPDMCITTDGGFWAREHLRCCPAQTVVLFPPEAAIPSRVLENNPVVFLSYSSDLEKKLFDLAGIKPVPAERNGTVAGTAVRYLLENSPGKIIAAGLDLSVSPSFSHARPHAFDPVLDAMADRTMPLAGILYGRAKNSFALDTYARWFSRNSATFGGRFYRIPASIRPIPGVPSKSLQEEPGKAATVTVKSQTVPGPDVRASRVILFLKECAKSILNHSGGTELEPEDGELLQLVSFSGYISALKTGDFRELCTETSRYLLRLAERMETRVR